MKILITGATGLVGNALIQLLLQEGNQVHFLSTSKQKLHSLHDCKGFYWNPTTGEIDPRCIEGVSVILHLAGASIAKRWTTEYKKELLQSRIQSAALLYKLLSTTSHAVKHYVSASGTAIYPDASNIVYTEESVVKDASFLGNVVAEWEESADRFLSLGCKVTKLRTGVVFDKSGGALPEMLRPIQYYVGAVFGNGKQLQSWISLKDLIRLYWFVMEHEITGVVNATSPVAVSNAHLTQQLAKAIHRPIWLPAIPKFVMQLILGEMHTLLFSDKNIHPKRALELGFVFNHPTIDDFIKDSFL